MNSTLEKRVLTVLECRSVSDLCRKAAQLMLPPRALFLGATRYLVLGGGLQKEGLGRGTILIFHGANPTKPWISDSVPGRGHGRLERRHPRPLLRQRSGLVQGRLRAGLGVAWSRNPLKAFYAFY